MKKFLLNINRYADDVGYPYVTFGVFGFIAYPLYYIVWIYANPVGYENLTLRLFAAFLCIILSLKDKWPVKFNRYLPIYWYFVILYCLPFFFTFMILKNGFSQDSSLNILAALVLYILLLDLWSFYILLVIGVFLGWLAYILTTKEISLRAEYPAIIISYASVLIVGSLFSHNKDKILRVRLNTMKTLSASIAHELRTPLSAIRLGAAAIRKNWHSIVNGYKGAVKHELVAQPITEKRIDKLAEVVTSIHTEANSASAFIDILLMNAKQFQAKSIELVECSIKKCVDEALERYPFQAYQRQLVHYSSDNHFLFKSDETLIIHVLFNLLKNGLYYVAEKGEGEISIHFEQDEHVNKLIFKDTGQGIERRNLSHIFDEFYSKTPHGAGIGLAFCKMVMQNSGGDITCDSVFGEFTKFTLIFPKYK